MRFQEVNLLGQMGCEFFVLLNTAKLSSNLHSYQLWGEVCFCFICLFLFSKTVGGVFSGSWSRQRKESCFSLTNGNSYKCCSFFFFPLEIQHPSCISPPHLTFHPFPPHISHIHALTQTHTHKATVITVEKNYLPLKCCWLDLGHESH